MVDTVGYAQVKSIAAAIQAAAESADRGNHVTISTLASGEVRIQIVLAGQPASWICFDGEQLAEFIRLLQTHQTDLGDRGNV